MLMRPLAVVITLVIAATLPLFAQAPPSNRFAVHTAADIDRIEAGLKLQAPTSPTGDASETLDDQGSHFLLLACRARTGEAELHQQWADEILVHSGSMTIFQGGVMSPGHPFGTRPGEIHSASMQGGQSQILHPGDWMHIPAGVPHRVKLDPGQTVCYFVVKEK